MITLDTKYGILTVCAENAAVFLLRNEAAIHKLYEYCWHYKLKTPVFAIKYDSFLC